jgi:hypothetical protein
LTPKSWFENGERRALAVHQNPVASTMLIGAELVENGDDRAQIERVIRSITNRPNVQVLKVRPVVGSDGKTRAYEVDIH